MHHVCLEIMKKIWKTVNARFLVYRNNGKIGRVSAGDGWKMWIFTILDKKFGQKMKI